jgi:hypothetical protein
LLVCQGMGSSGHDRAVWTASAPQPAWPQLQESSVIPAASSQEVLQYLLSLVRGQTQAG